MRLPYGSRTVDLPRQCVFSDTTNQDEYLRDGTGNRRYWPVLCIKAAIDQLARDRDQLWAEAVVQYRAGITWWPHDDMKSAFEAQQQLREISDPWEAVISVWLAQPDIELRVVKEEVTTAEILRDCLKIQPERMDERAMQMRVAKALRVLGFERRQSTDRSARAERRRIYLLRDQPKDKKP